ncbi:hypothetical protein HGI79_16135, partial [Clostridium sp. DJ247]|nr:hypothetical protein [Clostridium sp. DJ247]
MRVSEALNLLVRDFNPTEGILTVYHAKNNKDRLILLSPNITTGTHNYSYQYNGEGLRVSKTVDGQLTRYLYEYDKPILELNGSGNQIG